MDLGIEIIVWAGMAVGAALTICGILLVTWLMGRK